MLPAGVAQYEKKVRQLRNGKNPKELVGCEWENKQTNNGVSWLYSDQIRFPVLAVFWQCNSLLEWTVYGIELGRHIVHSHNTRLWWQGRHYLKYSDHLLQKSKYDISKNLSYLVFGRLRYWSSTNQGQPTRAAAILPGCSLWQTSTTVGLAEQSMALFWRW